MDGKSVDPVVEPDANTLVSEGKNRKPISGGKHYSTSRLYAYELDRRLRQAQLPISSIAYDLGFVPETGLGRTAPAFLQRLICTSLVKTLLRQLGVTMGRLSFSGAALAKVAVDPSFDDVSGKYFHFSNGSLVEARSSKASYDQAKAAKLWQDSEQLVHLERPMRLQQRWTERQTRGS